MQNFSMQIKISFAKWRPVCSGEGWGVGMGVGGRGAINSHLCVSKLVHHWFTWWLVASSVQGNSFNTVPQLPIIFNIFYWEQRKHKLTFSWLRFYEMLRWNLVALKIRKYWILMNDLSDFHKGKFQVLIMKHYTAIYESVFCVRRLV